MLMFRPFPSDLIGHIIQGKKGVTVLERLDQPLAVDLPLMREIRATVSKSLENGKDPRNPVYPELAAYKSLNDAPALYSGSFGMGSRDLQPEGIVGAVENMLEKGARKKLFYLSIDFLRDEAITPKQEMYQQTIQESYPDIKELAVRGSENPNLMPKDSITVRFHSIGGWGAITTGKNLAMTLFDLLGYHMKANPKYGSEKKGQPTTYYLSAAPEPIKINCEYFYVDVVLSPDPKASKKAASSSSRATRNRRKRCGRASRPCTRRSSSTRRSRFTTSTRSRSRGTRPPIPISSSGCRASHSRVRSSLPRQ
jgi:pyruvate-ferredoxin/flavodoxin oxidoreductase